MLPPVLIFLINFRAFNYFNMFSIITDGRSPGRQNGQAVFSPSGRCSTPRHRVCPNAEMRSRVQFNHVLTWCLIFKTNQHYQLHLHFIMMEFPLDVSVTGCGVIGNCHTLPKATGLTWHLQTPEISSYPSPYPLPVPAHSLGMAAPLIQSLIPFYLKVSRWEHFMPFLSCTFQV